MSRKYVIIDSDFVPSVDFSQVFETSTDTLRYSLDGSQTFVKYEGTKPRFLYGLDTLTHSEIRAILSSPEWRNPNPPE